MPQPDGSQLEVGCVSNFIKQFDQTDFRKVAENYAKKNGQTADYWRKKWAEKGKDACNMGTQVHEFAESLGWLRNGEAEKICQSARSQYNPLTNQLEPLVGYDKLSLKEQAVARFWEELHPDLHFVMAENKIVTSLGPLAEKDYKHNYAGTFDLLLYYDNKVDPQNSGFVIGDYKGLPLDTPIPTVNGFVNMGDLKEGMEVFDRDGKPCKILHCSEIHYNPCYKIIFDNNDELIADIDHRWQISFIRGEYSKEQVMTTKELKEYMNNSKRRSDLIPKILNPKSIDIKDKVLPIDPYVLGVWLGDGHSNSGYVTNMYPELFKEIESRGFSIGPDVSKGGSGKACTRNIFGLSTKLKQLNLLNNKHIPYEYLMSSYNQKLSLLRGFMDADGYYNKTRNRFETDTTRKYQKDFIVELLGSMGIKSTVINYTAKRSGKSIKAWKINWYMNDNPFLIRNKGLVLKNNKLHTYRYIKSIKECDMVPTRCIEVDSPSHTYLCTKKFIVTHNTNSSLTNDFAKRNGSYMATPFNDMIEESLSHYTIQLSCYQIPLEALGLKVIARRLIHLDDKGNYKLIPLPDVTDKIRNLLKHD